MATARLEPIDTPGIQATKMEPCSYGVLVNSPWDGDPPRAGDPVIRVRDELFFPVPGTWNQLREGILVRPLRPGEKIIIEG